MALSLKEVWIHKSSKASRALIVTEYEEEGRRSRRHSSPCNSREGSTTALHTQHYDDSTLIESDSIVSDRISAGLAKSGNTHYFGAAPLVNSCARDDGHWGVVKS
ncbi:hypothetical protein SFRURICE_020552 [Spodoptera frugiperda]|nr:hypothetical protein SFRURICE_020552 [Spodoptera frugiperda]